MTHARIVGLPRGLELRVETLRDGDVGSVLAVFDRLSDASRRARFHGPKPCLGDAELRQLAGVDARRHALVGYVEGDSQPVAIARLVRIGERSAEVAFAVADEYQHRGIGAALTRELVADARAAGITEITALASSDNPAALALLRRAGDVLDVVREGADLSVRTAIA